MFYTDLIKPGSSPEVEFFLINNFIEKIPLVVNKITINIQEMCQGEFEKKKYDIDLKKFIEDDFKLLLVAKRDLKIEQVANTETFFKKLSENGLTGESLFTKLKVLDWFWEKAKNNFYELRGGNNENGNFYNIFFSLLNQMKSILKSILNLLNISSDIFDEIFDLLISLLEMCNTRTQEI